MSWAARRDLPLLGCLKTMTAFLFGVRFWEWIQIKVGKNFPICWLPKPNEPMPIFSLCSSPPQRITAHYGRLMCWAINHEGGSDTVGQTVSSKKLGNAQDSTFADCSGGLALVRDPIRTSVMAQRSDFCIRLRAAF